MKAKFEMFQLVRPNNVENADAFHVNGIKIENGMFFYQDFGLDAWFNEDNLEKVVPKKMFYLWVEKANGRIYDYVLDKNGCNTRGQKVSVTGKERLEGAGTLLELREGPQPKKSARSYEEEEEEFEEED